MILKPMISTQDRRGRKACKIANRLLHDFKHLCKGFPKVIFKERKIMFDVSQQTTEFFQQESILLFLCKRKAFEFTE